MACEENKCERCGTHRVWVKHVEDRYCPNCEREGRKWKHVEECTPATQEYVAFTDGETLYIGYCADDIFYEVDGHPPENITHWAHHPFLKNIGLVLDYEFLKDGQ